MKENWRGEEDKKKGDENKNVEMMNPVMFGSICKHYCKVFGKTII